MVIGASHRTSGIAPIDALIEGIRTGDNFVVVLHDGLSGEWIIERFAAAASPRPLIIAQTGRLPGMSTVADTVLDWTPSSDVGHDPQRARAQLRHADVKAGTDAVFVISSLSTLAHTWGEDEALDLYLWACPRLFRRRSVALWLVNASAHSAGFLRHLADITQVMITIRADEGNLRIEVTKADGRPPAVRGRTTYARIVDGNLIEQNGETNTRQRLGPLIRSMRTDRGVSQVDLAHRVGISPSALSQAERGVAGISADTLIRIWDALGVPIAPTTSETARYRIHRRGQHEHVNIAVGVIGHRLAGDDAGMWHLRIEPRASSRSPMFTVKSTETIAVIRGVLQIELDGGTETLHEGDSLVAPRSPVTAWTNPSDTTAELIWSITP